MELLLVIVALAVFGVVSIVVGVDSTDASSDPRRQARPVGIN
jgi:hypothetical protein